MKLLIGLLCALGLSGAYAQEYSATTKNGGEIRLTYRKCESNQYKRPFLVYSRAPDSRAIYGCWSMEGNEIHVRWDDGDNRIYPASGFYEVPGTAPTTKKGTNL
jgi:hypothetical protein